MTFTFRGHSYDTHFNMGVRTRLSKWFGSYQYPVNMWFSHGDGCCDYWLTDDEGMIRALRQDDYLGVSHDRRP